MCLTVWPMGAWELLILYRCGRVRVDQIWIWYLYFISKLTHDMNNDRDKKKIYFICLVFNIMFFFAKKKGDSLEYKN